jgi:multiple sugar transport system permease protein
MSAALLQRRAGQYVALGLLTLGALVMVFPFVWMILTSVKPLREILAFPPAFFPHHLAPSNYEHAWSEPRLTFGRYYLNSFILAAGGTLLRTVVAVLAAYAFAQMRFRGRGVLFGLFLLTMMVPEEVTLVPNFVIIRHFPLFGGNNVLGAGGHGLTNSYLGMILPTAADGFSVFLMRQAFVRVPIAYWDAARLEGCHRFQYLRRVALPLVKPTLAVVIVLSVFSYWNSLLWPLVVTQSDTIRPVQVAMLFFNSEFNTQPGWTMAAAAMSIAPIMILYFFVQKQFRASIAYSGLRG